VKQQRPAYFRVSGNTIYFSCGYQKIPTNAFIPFTYFDSYRVITIYNILVEYQISRNLLGWKVATWKTRKYMDE
jgi:hypothetical protein